MDEVVNQIIEEINQFQTKDESIAREVGVIIHKHLLNINARKHKKIVSTIKKSENLKLRPSYVYEVWKMVGKFSEMMKDDWKPLPNLTITHYYEASKYKINPFVVKAQILEPASEAGGISIKELKEQIIALKEENITFADRDKMDLLKQIYPIIRRRTVDELKSILAVFKEKYPEPRK